MIDSWDKHFMQDARWVSRKSKDRSVKVGCVIANERNVVLSSGWNGFPRGVDDEVECRHERPAKYKWTEHAERNAIYNAAAEGIALRGATAYVTSLPCADCARGLIQAGIKRVCTAVPDVVPSKGSSLLDDHAVTQQMFFEAGVDIVWFDTRELT